MKTTFLTGLLLLCAGTPAAQAQTGIKTITVEVSNAWDKDKADAPVVLKIKDLRPGFRVRSAVVMNGTEVIKPEVTLNWGSWVQTVVNFIIIAFCIFVMIKFVNKLSRKKAEEPAPAESEPTKEEVLLTEIRDLLKDRKPE
jgi:large conductance mechanosensitive channel protein